MEELNNIQKMSFSTTAKPQYNKILNRIKRAWGLYLLLLIPVIYVFIFNYIPMYCVTIAFKRYN
ncbi:MAG: hypothetical protein QJR05_10530, partial [Thermoanaerobacterium sp.]|nr:hypothetical protein [Thermoanaerobacterium sp.]